jgi:hypothetical protein
MYGEELLGVNVKELPHMKSFNLQSAELTPGRTQRARRRSHTTSNIPKIQCQQYGIAQTDQDISQSI